MASLIKGMYIYITVVSIRSVSAQSFIHWHYHLTVYVDITIIITQKNCLDITDWNTLPRNLVTISRWFLAPVEEYVYISLIYSNGTFELKVPQFLMRTHTYIITNSTYCGHIDISW